MASAKYECKLSADLQEKAKKELNEKPEWRDRDIQALRDMVIAHKGLKANTSDEFLLRFLRARKFDYDRAYDLLINYYTVRARNPEYFQGLVPSASKHIFDAGVTAILPKRDAEGRVIMYFRPGLWDAAKYPIFDNLKANTINFELMIQEEETQINGLVFIGDFSGFGMTHAKNFDRNYGKIMSNMLQDAFPMRLKALHFVNEPAPFQYVFSMIKPFMKEKLVSRLNFHGSNLASLHKHMGKDVLPEELGGTLGKAETLANSWRDMVLAEEDLFVTLQNFSIEVPRDITKTKNDEQVDCLVGTYRKLNVD